MSGYVTLPDSMTFDAIIIGGGPAGATSALALARLGWSVAIVEKAAYPRHKVCGEFMSATTLAVIDRLGIGDAWRAQAGPQIRRLALFAGEDVVEARVPATKSASFGRALGRDVLDEMVLASAEAAGARVFQPSRAVALSVGDAISTVEILHRGASATLRAPVLIAAHGSWERGSLPTQLGKVRNPSDLLGFKTHFRGVTMAPDLMPLLAFPGGYGGLAWADTDACPRPTACAAMRSPAPAKRMAAARPRRCIATSWPPAVACARCAATPSRTSPGSPPGQCGRASDTAMTAACSTSATLPASRTPSSPRAFRWRSSRRGC